MKYSFTGIRELADPSLIHDTMKKLKNAEEFNSGAAFGTDTLVAMFGYEFPDVYTRVIVPSGERYNEDALNYVDEIIYVPKQESAAATYRLRNKRLVQYCNTLIAFPKTPKEELRSGTWMTIRMARKAGKEVKIFPLKGE